MTLPSSRLLFSRKTDTQAASCYILTLLTSRITRGQKRKWAVTSCVRPRSGEDLADSASTSALPPLCWTPPLFLSLSSHLSTSHFSLFIACPPSLPPSFFFFSSFLLCNNPSALHPPTVFSTPRILWELSKNRRERSGEAEMNSSDNFIKYTDSEFRDPSGPLNPTCSRCLRQPLTSWSLMSALSPGSEKESGRKENANVPSSSFSHPPLVCLRFL